jgi:hypothetical protein
MSRSEAPAIWEIVVADKGAGPYGIAAVAPSVVKASSPLREALPAWEHQRRGRARVGGDP